MRPAVVNRKLNSRERDASKIPVAAARPKVPALKRGLAVVRLLNAAPGLAAGVTEVANSLRLTKSVSFNILRTLQEEGWVTFDAERKKYVLSAHCLGDFSSLLTTSKRAANMHQELVRLSLRTRVPCVLSRVEPDGSFITVDKAEEAAELLVSVPIGHRFPDDAPAQMRVRLAWSDARTRQAFFKRWKAVAHTATTIVDRRQLEKELAATLARGYAISRAEFTPGVMSLAAPIFSKAGRVELVLQCPGVAPDVEAREREIATAMLECAGRLNDIIALS